MSSFFVKARRSGGMTGELARKARSSAAGAGVHQPRRVGGCSSLIRLSVPREDGMQWTQNVVQRAATLAHWMSSRSHARPATVFGHSEFSASVLPSA
jgi:hypothetical protein